MAPLCPLDVSAGPLGSLGAGRDRLCVRGVRRARWGTPGRPFQYAFGKSWGRSVRVGLYCGAWWPMRVRWVRLGQRYLPVRAGPAGWALSLRTGVERAFRGLLRSVCLAWVSVMLVVVGLAGLCVSENAVAVIVIASSNPQSPVFYLVG